MRYFIENVPRATIYSAIERIETTGNSTFKAISGRPKLEKTKRAAKLIDQTLEMKPTTIVRSLAQIAQASKSTTHELKIELDYKSYTKQPASKTNQDQEGRIQNL